jgi:hypothetical protein
MPFQNEIQITDVIYYISFTQHSRHTTRQEFMPKNAYYILKENKGGFLKAMVMFKGNIPISFIIYRRF